MAIPVLKKNDTSAIDKAREGILQERLDAFEKGISRVINSMDNLDTPSKMKKKQEALDKTRERLERQLQNDRLVLASENKKLLQQHISQLKAEQEILKKEYEATQTAESKIELEKVTKQIEKLEARETRYDKKEKKLEKKFEKRQRGVIGLLNPVAKGILAGGKGIVGAITDKYKENKEGIKSALLGPFSIISGALENAGIDFSKPFGFLKDKIGGLFSKKENNGKSSFGGKGGRDSKSSKSFDPFSLSSSPREKSQSSSLLPSFISSPSSEDSISKSNSNGKTKTKTKPSIKDVASIGDMGALLLFNLLNKKVKKGVTDENEEGGGGLLSSLLGGAGLGGLIKGGLMKGGLGKSLLKGGAITAIIGSLIWMAIDGFKGYAKSGEWGVSKAGGVVGAVLGGTSEGWKGAFANAGKWGLMGVGVGFLAGGPVGALIGGLVGAAVGGILGFIRGKRIASGFDKLKKWLFEHIDFKAILMATPVGAVITLVNDLKSIWGDKDKTIGQKILGTIKGWGNFVLNLVFSPLKMIGGFFTGKFFTEEAKNKLKDTVDKIKNLLFENINFKAILMATPVGAVINLVNNLKSVWGDEDKTIGQKILGTIKGLGKFALSIVFAPLRFIGSFSSGKFFTKEAKKKLKETAGNLFSGIRNLFNKSAAGRWIFTKVIEPVGKFLHSLFTDPVGTVLDVGKWALDTLISPVTGMIKDGFFKVKDLMPDTIKKLIFEPIENAFGFISDLFGFLFSDQFKVSDLLVAVVSDEKRAEIFSNFSNYVSSKQAERSGVKEVGSVDDGIIRSDGSFISISPDDNVYATKNDLVSSISNGSSSSKSSTSIDSIKEDIIDKFDELIRAVIESNKVIVAPNNNLNLDIFKV